MIGCLHNGSNKQCSSWCTSAVSNYSLEIQYQTTVRERPRTILVLNALPPTGGDQAHLVPCMSSTVQVVGNKTNAEQPSTRRIWNAELAFVRLAIADS